MRNQQSEHGCSITYHEFVVKLGPDEIDALLVRGQGVGVVPGGRVHVAQAGSDSIKQSGL